MCIRREERLVATKWILGKHPTPTAFGCYTVAEDGSTSAGVEHRSLLQESAHCDQTIGQLREALVRHHMNPEMVARDRRRNERLRELGYPITDGTTRRFPISDKTRKGNLAEVFLAEYVVASTPADLPVYRLRYNPNVEQSMKGDDVLAFDFSSKRTRILVGEAKFRTTPSKKAVQDIVGGLVRSHDGSLPASLQFVADRLFEAGDPTLGDRVSDCALLMAQGKLDLHYVGLLLSNTNTKSQVDQHTTNDLRTLVMISLGVDNPNTLLSDCFDAIEEQANGDSD